LPPGRSISAMVAVIEMPQVAQYRAGELFAWPHLGQ